MKKSFKIALIGSSGGGSATISSGEDVVDSIQRNVNLISSQSMVTSEKKIVVVSITDVALVQCHHGLDFSTTQEDDSATLWVMKDGGSLVRTHVGTLASVNSLLRFEDLRISDLILSDEIDAIVSISSDPQDTNKLTVAAAIQMNIPILGTGGTSLSYISTSGGNVIGCSGGSVATTGLTRGICIAASLASYKPWGKMDYALPNMKLAKFRSVVGAALPVLLAVSLMKCLLPLCQQGASSVLALFVRALFHPAVNEIMCRLPILSQAVVNISSFLLIEPLKGSGKNIGDILDHSYRQWYGDVLFSLEQKVIPVVISSLTCLEISKLQELSLLSGAAAGALVSGNIFCAYFSGSLCGLLLPWLLVKCARNSLLPTSTAIISVGASAILSGLVASIFSIPMNLLTNFIFEKIHEMANSAAIYIFGSVFVGFTVFGAGLGWGVSWGSEEGYYHLVMLPLIAVYMDQGYFSVLGTLDMLCLCVPCAGVCSAVYGIGVLRSALSPLPQVKVGEAQITVTGAACIAADSDSLNDTGLHSGTAIPEPSDSTSQPTSKSFRGSTPEPSMSSSLHVSDKYFLSSSTNSNNNNSNNSNNSSSSVLYSDSVSSPGQAVNRTNHSVSPSPSPPRVFDENESSSNPKSLPLVCDDNNASMSPSPQMFPEISPVNIPKDTPLIFEGYNHHIRLGWKGTLSNLLMGDYVEACYPYTLSNRWVLYSVRVSSAIAGGLILGYFGVIGDCKKGSGLGSSLSSSAVLYEREKMMHYSASSSSSSSHRDYAFQSTAYLPLPISMLLALTGHQPECTRGTKLPLYVSYLPTGIQILNSPYNFILKMFYQMMDYDHPGACTVLVAAVLLSYSIPFLTTLIVYSWKGKLKLKKEIH